MEKTLIISHRWISSFQGLLFVWTWLHQSRFAICRVLGLVSTLGSPDFISTASTESKMERCHFLGGPRPWGELSTAARVTLWWCLAFTGSLAAYCLCDYPAQLLLRDVDTQGQRGSTGMFSSLISQSSNSLPDLGCSWGSSRILLYLFFHNLATESKVDPGWPPSNSVHLLCF